ncbi:antitoxin [Actinobacillus porcinus]|uniref:antitoxin n=1 Tax=Actinobacillus porcinus TaxID=51048 RepID=UPI0023EFCB77|nr:AbrB/MazE/SpoVT family DNA-binding domain-containing protein [Actinobacillus porcinus]MDD7545959.1 AbrB/MazE/SpoVT family DNA-binding domain-containing protein [Actinobacillus porcinus]MDY5847205.1 AbrB/MazE/SpoVT family DNA-binding domain-containing protein [Actinobacillus porcinus]
MQTAKLFTNGRSQAVRLPAAFRFNVDEVYIRQDPETGDVILSRKPADWASFFNAAKNLELGEFEIVRDKTEHQRDPFEGWKE